MAGTGIVITIDGLDDWQKSLDELARLGGEAEPLMEAIGEEIRSQVMEHFDTGQGPDGREWKPSARALEENGQTLVDTARLRNSIGYAASGRQVEVGTNVIYAAIHQFGGEDAGMPQIPARPFMPENMDQIRGLAGIIEDFIAQALQ